MPANFSLRRPNQRGFTLLEIAIVLSIVGIIIAGVWFYGAQTLYNSKVEKLQSQIVHIITRSHEVFANNYVPPFTVLTQGAITANIFPADTLASSTASGSTSGYIALEPFANANGTQAPYSLSTSGVLLGSPLFDLSIPSVPTDACIKILLYMGAKSTVKQLGLLDFGPASSPGAYGFGVNGLDLSWATAKCSDPSRVGLGIEFQI